MKVCEVCGEEIWTKDGENMCPDCDKRDAWIETHSTLTPEQRAAVRNKARRAREEALRSLGLVKVRGALGGTYWE